MSADLQWIAARRLVAEGLNLPPEECDRLLTEARRKCNSPTVELWAAVAIALNNLEQQNHGN
jgi:hypothetical protein